MATATSDSFLSVSQRFFSPDILQKISSEINQPIEQTKVGLRSVIPTLFMGIVNKGSTKEGAESLLNMASKQEENPSISADPGLAKEGSDFLNGIFGSNLSDVISKLGVTTGMNTGSITKMLKMIAPMVMGMIGSKIKSEKMSASGLMNFLSQQKSSLSSLLPAGMFGIQNKVAATGKSILPKILFVVLVLAGLAGGMWVYNSIFSGGETTSIFKTVPAPVATVPQVPLVEPLTALEAFAKLNVPAGTAKRFRFEQLKFRTGSTEIDSGSEFEINQIVSAMKASPTVTVKIEGFTDNIGSTQGNINLSNQRAVAVKNQLISKGIPSRRIQAQGMGASNPIGSNETEAGRAANRRIEIIVKH